MSVNPRNLELYHAALNSLDAANEIIEEYPDTHRQIHPWAQIVRDRLLKVENGITLLETLRRAAAEEVESKERTL